MEAKRKSVGIVINPDRWRVRLEMVESTNEEGVVQRDLDIVEISDEDDGEGATVVHVAPLPADIGLDAMTALRKEDPLSVARVLMPVAHKFIVGWENLKDAKGGDVPYSANAIKKIPMSYIGRIGLFSYMMSWTPKEDREEGNAP